MFNKSKFILQELEALVLSNVRLNDSMLEHLACGKTDNLSCKETCNLNYDQIMHQILNADSLKISVKRAKELHLYYIHHARIKMVMSLLPPARVIVDLGGANGSIYDMGYPYEFDRLTVVDLPVENRCEMYKGLQLKPKETPNGPIYIQYCNMTDLSCFEDASVELVWSGQSIEHITESDANRVFQEVLRILKPGGYFCLDTPNRLVTEIHTSWRGGWIHPEHKIEYYPHQLKHDLMEAGFKIIAERGICEMPKTWQTKSFNYTDFVLGNALSYNVESSYIQYYQCQKPR